jgi:hypothetical protein
MQPPASPTVFELPAAPMCRNRRIESISTAITMVAAIMVTFISPMITIFTAILVSPITVVMASVRLNKAAAQTNHQQAYD